MGKFTDKFMSAFNSGNDDFDEFDDELYEDEPFDEDDFEEAEQPVTRGSLFRRKAQPEERESREVREPRETREAREPREREAKETPARSTGSSPFGRAQKSTPAPRTGSSRMGGNEVCIFKPTSIEDSREITETLLQGKAVVINFEGLHVEISQRIIDFISGSCYALDGNLQKISNYIFIATPNSVDISGDFQDLFGGEDGSFDLAGFKHPLI